MSMHGKSQLNCDTKCLRVVQVLKYHITIAKPLFWNKVSPDAD